MVIHYLIILRFNNDIHISMESHGITLTSYPIMTSVVDPPHPLLPPAVNMNRAV